jgi:lipoate synthase
MAKQKAAAKLIIAAIPVKVVQGELLKKTGLDPRWAGSPTTRFMRSNRSLRENKLNTTVCESLYLSVRCFGRGTATLILWACRRCPLRKRGAWPAHDPLDMTSR